MAPRDVALVNVPGGQSKHFSIPSASLRNIDKTNNDKVFFFLQKKKLLNNEIRLICYTTWKNMRSYEARIFGQICNLHQARKLTLMREELKGMEEAKL